MDLNQVAVFVHVVRAGSFSAAARQLGLPVSTVSHRVAALEQRLGVTLLQRTTRRLHVTEAGQLYFEHAAAGLAAMQDAETALSQTAQTLAGRLRITAPADMGDALMTQLVQQLRQRWPQLQIELLLSNRYVDLVAEGVDVAIRTGELKDSTLIARQVGMARWASFASPTYLAGAPPLRGPQALGQHCCLQFTPLGREAWTLHGAHSSVTVPMSGAVMANDIGLISTMALAGEGVALLPEYLCRQACDDGRLQRVLPDWYAKADPIHIVYPRQRFMPPRLRAFLDLATELLNRHLDA